MSIFNYFTFSTHIETHIVRKMYIGFSVLKKKWWSWCFFNHCRFPVLSPLSALHTAASHYSSLLEMEGVTELLKALAAHPDTHADIKRLSESILHMVEEQPSQSKPPNTRTSPSNS